MAVIDSQVHLYEPDHENRPCSPKIASMDGDTLRDRVKLRLVEAQEAHGIAAHNADGLFLRHIVQRVAQPGDRVRPCAFPVRIVAAERQTPRLSSGFAQGRRLPTSPVRWQYELLIRASMGGNLI